MYQTTTSHQCYSQIFLTFMWEEIVFLYLSMYILDPCLAELRCILRIYFKDSYMTLDTKKIWNVRVNYAIHMIRKKVQFHIMTYSYYHHWLFYGDTSNSYIKESRLESIKLNFFLKINLRGCHSGCLRFGVFFSIL